MYKRVHAHETYHWRKAHPPALATTALNQRGALTVMLRVSLSESRAVPTAVLRIPSIPPEHGVYRCNICEKDPDGARKKKTGKGQIIRKRTEID